tara:strand:+ start:39 stop:257 length:219 start_codon:yes stop_codon:yes gene_type:complete
MKITGTELLKKAREGRPSVEYRLDARHETIAAKVNGEWRRVAGKLVNGNEWVEMPELLINGKRTPFLPDMAT